MTCPCPPPVIEPARTTRTLRDDCPTHGEESRWGWGEESQP